MLAKAWLKIIVLILLATAAGCATLPQLEAMRGTDKAVRVTYKADIDTVFEGIKFGYNYKLRYLGSMGEFDSRNHRILGRHRDAHSQFMWGVFLESLNNGDTQVDFVGAGCCPSSKVVAESIQGGLEAYLAGKQDTWIKEWTERRSPPPDEPIE